MERNWAGKYRRNRGRSAESIRAGRVSSRPAGRWRRSRKTCDSIFAAPLELSCDRFSGRWHARRSQRCHPTHYRGSERQQRKNWPAPNLGDRILDLRLEIDSEPMRATLIEAHGVIEFGSRRAVNHHRLHECFARSSENTFSAGSPTARPPSISSARRTSSASHAVSASPSEP